MAVYKVIQDIEAEDKLLGPLTLKGFIYAAITAILAFISIRLAIGGIPGFIKIIFILLFLPPMVLFGVLASPLGREQPTEVWLLSRIIFLFKPHSRKWDQTGPNQTVTITAPKRATQQLTKNFSQTEVDSRLQALANTLDSRGWAIKNVNINLNTETGQQSMEASDDRLTDASTLVEPAPDIDVRAADDILDEQNNPAAQNLASMVQKAEDDRQLALADQLNATRVEAERQARAQTKADQNEPLTPDEKVLLERIHQEASQPKELPKIIKGAATFGTVTPAPQTVKLELANAGNALSVATIAQLAGRNQLPQEMSASA